MRFGGYIIHSKSNVSNIIEKCKNLAENYNVKFKRQNTEDYSWKIEGFQKAHFYFDIYDDSISFSYLLGLVKEITHKEPSVIELSMKENCSVTFNYYTDADRFGSTDEEDLFAIFDIVGNYEELLISENEFLYIKELNKKYNSSQI